MTLEMFEQKKKLLTEKGAKHDKVVVLSLVLEASIEASFQVKGITSFQDIFSSNISISKMIFSVFLSNCVRSSLVHKERDTGGGQ